MRRNNLWHTNFFKRSLYWLASVGGAPYCARTIYFLHLRSRRATAHLEKGKAKGEIERERQKKKETERKKGGREKGAHSPSFACPHFADRGSAPEASPLYFNAHCTTKFLVMKKREMKGGRDDFTGEQEQVCT